MDAARISDVRENVKAGGWLTAAEALDLLDALEQAQKERDEAEERWKTSNGISNAAIDKAKQMRIQRDQAQKDAKDARALAYEECAKAADDLNADKCASGVYEHGYWDACNEVAATLRARIEAMLTPHHITTKGDQT